MKNFDLFFEILIVVEIFVPYYYRRDVSRSCFANFLGHHENLDRKKKKRSITCTAN